MRSRTNGLKAGVAAFTVVAALAAAPVAVADSGGGMAPPGSSPPSTPPAPAPPPSCSVGSGGVGQSDSTCAPTETATLVGGRAIAPSDAPARVKAVIAAANRISTKPYIWGGGHRHWWDSGYDCSGSVSFVLHRGGFLSTPMDSSGLMRWGRAGTGHWITVYSNAGHAYAVIAGLRWDTAGDASGSGPRWHPTLAAAASGAFTVRHPAGY